MKKINNQTFVEAIWQGIRLELPVYPWFNNKTHQVYPKNVFREMQRYQVSWMEAKEMLEEAKALRNKFMGRDLGNDEVYLVRDNQRFAFGIYRSYTLTAKGTKHLNTGEFHLCDYFSQSLGGFRIENVHMPPTDEQISWIESATEEYCNGLIHCSKCGKKVKQSEIAGRYFAGIYCQECWEGGVREIEARENYD